jgi:hypothetical protein
MRPNLSLLQVVDVLGRIRKEDHLNGENQTRLGLLDIECYQFFAGRLPEFSV